MDWPSFGLRVWPGIGTEQNGEIFNREDTFRNFARRFENIHRLLPGRIWNAQAHTRVMDFDVMMSPFLKVATRYSFAMDIPTDWTHFTDSVGHEGLPALYNASTKTRKRFFCQIALSLAFWNAIITMRASPPFTFLRDNTSTTTKLFYQRVSERFLETITNSRGRIRRLLASIHQSESELSPIWSLPLLDLMCIIDTLAYFTFRHGNVPDNDQVATHIIQNVQNVIFTAEHTPAEISPELLEMIIAVIEILPENMNFQGAMQRLEQGTNLLRQQCTGRQLSHALNEGNLLRRSTRNDIVNDRNRCEHQMATLMRAVDERSPNHQGRHMYQMSENRLILRQHALQTVAFSDAALVITNDAVRQGAQQNNQPPTHYLAQSLNSIVGQNHSSSRIHAHFQNQRFDFPLDAQEAPQEDEVEMRFCDYELLKMLNGVYRVLRDMGWLQSEAIYRQRARDLIDDFKWMYVYTQRPVTEAGDPISLDRFLFLLCRLHPMTVHQDPGQIEIFQNPIPPNNQ